MYFSNIYDILGIKMIRFYPVESFQIDNYRLFLVISIIDIFSGYRIHTSNISVLIKVNIKEFV